VVALADMGREQAEDRLLGAGEDEDVIGLERVVQRGDLAPQQGVAGRFRVAEAQAGPQRPGLGVGQFEQRDHRPALDVAGAGDVLDRELPAGEVALQREVGDAHGGMMRHGGRRRLRAHGARPHRPYF